MFISNGANASFCCSSCCRRACPIYMECGGVEWSKNDSNYFLLLVISFFFSDVVQSFVSLELLRGGGRKYFPCMDLQISRRTLHSSGLTWNACERSFPFLAVREIYERACTLNSGDCSMMICSELIENLETIFLKWIKDNFKFAMVI